MPVTEQTPVVTYNGNGVTTVFAYNFKIIAAADLEVTVDGVVKTLTTHYSVSGVGSEGGGNVTMVTAPASGTANVVLRRDMAYNRTTDYQDNGDLLAVTADEDADRPIMMIQQLVADLFRSIKLPVGTTENQVLGSVAERANKLIGFDVNGDMIMYTPATELASLNFLQAGAGAVSRTYQNKMRESVSVFDFMTTTEVAAVQNNTVLDVTAAVQTAIDYIETVRAGRLIFPAGDYRVTQITLGRTGVRLGTTYDFQNANIVGIAAVSTRSIVQIKCGSATIRNLAVSGAQSANYQCGVHWYTNDLNTWYPGLNRIDGMLINGCVIGLMIGALPSQADPIPAQGTVQAEGIATDAPISECYVGGLRVQDCITGVYMRQPNGKLTFTSPTLTTSNAAWSGAGASAEANCNALYIYGSELTILGGFIENIDDTDGCLLNCQSSTLNIVGTALEGKSPIRIGGRTTLNMSSIQNWGMNNDAMAFFHVKDDTEGCLNLSDMFLRRGYGTAATQPVVKTVDNITLTNGGASAANGKFWVNATNVEFGDCNFTQGATYNPLVAGCRAKFKNCWATTHSGVDPYPVTQALKIDEGTNLLSGKVDLAADVITAYGVNASATSGGWTFTNGAGTSSWGKDLSSLPSIEGVTPHYALRITAAGGGASVSSASPKFPVEPQRTYLLKGWMRTNAAGSQNVLRLAWYDFGGAAASTTETNLYVGAVGPLGATWSPFMMWAQAPKDATQAEVFLYSENGSELWTVALELV